MSVVNRERGRKREIEREKEREVGVGETMKSFVCILVLSIFGFVVMVACLHFSLQFNIAINVFTVSFLSFYHLPHFFLSIV